MLQLLQRLPQFRNLLQQFKKSEVSTDNNFRDFNVMDQATGEVKKLEEQTVAQKMVGGGISRPEQPIKGVKPIQVKGRKFQGIF
jgi:chaperonin cofactor prefoldin